jgi:hypothetical protein
MHWTHGIGASIVRPCASERSASDEDVAIFNALAPSVILTGGSLDGLRVQQIGRNGRFVQESASSGANVAGRWGFRRPLTDSAAHEMATE